MKIHPKRKQVVGRVATFAKTNGGIELVGAKGVTTFIVVDGVGSQVTEYAVGDIVVPHKFNHIFLPDGRESRAVLHEDEILAVITDISLDQLNIVGAPQATADRGAESVS